MGKVVRFRNKGRKKNRSTRRPKSTTCPQKHREVWQVAMVRMPFWIDNPDDPPAFRPWNAMAFSLTQDLIEGSDVGPRGERNEDWIFESIHKLRKLCGRGPDCIEISDPGMESILRDSPDLANVEIVHRPTLAGLNLVVDRMAENFGTESRIMPPATSVPGLTTEHLQNFARSFERFFEAAPWTELENEDIIRIESPVPDPSLRHLTVMGAAGEEFGLMSMEHIEDVRRFGDIPPAEILQTTSLWSVSLFEPHMLHFREHDLWEDEGFPLFDAGLIPAAVRFGPKDRLRRTSPKVLAFIESILLALAETTLEDLDAESWSRTVTTGAGTRTLEFSLLDSGDPIEDNDELGNLPHPVLIERARLQMDGGRAVEDDPRRQAQELAYNAMEAHGRRRKSLARKALKLWPECVDALGILAASETDPVEAIKLLERAVEAGRKDLGEQAFTDDVGHFWGLTETRPYMRVRYSLAHGLWETGRTGDALDHFRDLLRLNPGDNQGVRFFFAPALIQTGHFDETERLLMAFKDDCGAWWAFTWALLTFLTQGDHALARRRLTAAFKTNPYLAPMLIGRMDLPPNTPSYFQFGEVTEAQALIFDLLPVWSASEGAIEWTTKRWDYFNRE